MHNKRGNFILKTGTALLVAFALIAFGAWDCLKYKNTTRAINEAVKLFRLFKNEIHYRGTDYYSLCRLAEKENFKYITFAENKITLNGVSDFTVNNEFSYYTEKIGTTDTQGQLALCDEAIEKLNASFLEHRRKENSRLQVNMSLSFLSALSIILIFI